MKRLSWRRARVPVRRTVTSAQGGQPKPAGDESADYADRRRTSEERHCALRINGEALRQSMRELSLWINSHRSGVTNRRGLPRGRGTDRPRACDTRRRNASSRITQFPRCTAFSHGRVESRIGRGIAPPSQGTPDDRHHRRRSLLGCDRGS